MDFQDGEQDGRGRKRVRGVCRERPEVKSIHVWASSGRLVLVETTIASAYSSGAGATRTRRS
jgi:hypothetical protein